MTPVLVLATAFAFAPADADLAYETARTLVETCTPRDAGTPDAAEGAANLILAAARAAGATARRDVFRAATPAGVRTFANVEAELAGGGTNAEWVVLVSHFDTKPGTGCPGANDGGSTAGLLVGLVRAFARAKAPKGNLLFLWTDGEECMQAYAENDGLWGSKRAAAHWAAQRRSVRAVICLDMLGDADLAITVPANGTDALAAVAVLAAGRAGHPGLVRRVPHGIKDDHVAFLERGFPAIDLIDFSYGPENGYWHTPQDTLDKISATSLLKSGKVVAEMLNILL